MAFGDGVSASRGIVSIPEYVMDDQGNRQYATVGQYAAVSMINAAWTEGESAAAAFSTDVDDADKKITDLQGRNDLHIKVAAAGIGIEEPQFELPTAFSSSDVLSTFEAKQQEIIAQLKAEFDEFKGRFFANDTAFDGAVTWLDDAVDGKYGISDAMAEQIMADAKSSIYADAVVQSDAILATFAARRFPLPPGAAASAVLQVQQKSQEAVADSARKLMVAAIENAKFSVSKSMELRKLAMDSTAEYIKAIVSGNSQTAQMLNTGYDAQSKMISAITGYYNARIDAAKARAQVEQFNVSKTFDKDVKNLDVDIGLVTERVKLLLTEAQALAQIATSLFNNLNVSANTNA